MAVEIDGKRMFTQRSNGAAFELPEHDTAELTLGLSTPNDHEGGVYRVDRLQFDEERVVVHVNEELRKTGLSVGEDWPGYPFPHD